MKPQFSKIASLALLLGAASCSGNKNDSAADGVLEDPSEMPAQPEQVTGDESSGLSLSTSVPTDDQKFLCGFIIQQITERSAFSSLVVVIDPVGPYPRVRQSKPSGGSQDQSIFECRFEGRKVVWRSAAEGTNEFSGWSDEIGGDYAIFEVVDQVTTITFTRSDGSTFVKKITKPQR